ncbi:MAG: DUF4907 domain-containing protein [Ferruginibacter sp.]
MHTTTTNKGMKLSMIAAAILSNTMNVISRFMKRSFVLCCSICCLLFFLLANSPLQAQSKKNAVSFLIKDNAAGYTYKIIDAAGATFGYDIYKNGRLAIHQPSVPAMPGNKGFKTKEAVVKVARLAIQKMSNGESLPTISIKEMQKLKSI